MKKNSKKLTPFLTGNNAENFIEHLSQITFLQPWVFKNPRCSDNDEFSDIVIFFKDLLILIEVKGNSFDPANPQRYLKQAQNRHRQLKRANNIVKRKSKKVIFKNNFFSFESDFSDVSKIYLVSVATGHGEREVASGKNEINYSKLNSKEVGKFLGFYNYNDDIHSFTMSELVFASQHIDTLKDFCWYLDFEKKFFLNKFERKKDKQIILPLIDVNREDLIATYVLNYYWDSELNKTGEVKLNKILDDESLEKADFIVYNVTNASSFFKNSDFYKKIKKEKKTSYIWDNLIYFALQNCTYAYSVTNTGREDLRKADVKEILEEMSTLSRLERVVFSEKIKEVEEKELNQRNLFWDAIQSSVLFSYGTVEYSKIPTPKEQDDVSQLRLYEVLCNSEFSKKLEPIKSRIKKTVVIIKHIYNRQTAMSFALSSGISVDKKICENISAIPKYYE